MLVVNQGKISDKFIYIYYNMASDGATATLIIIIFVIISLITVLGFNLQHIKLNWKKYRCNPMIMPIAHIFGEDAEKNHKECTAAVQSSFMDSLLAPIRGSQLANANNSHKTAAKTNDTKRKANDTKFKLSNLMSGLFNKTNNVLIEFNRMGYSMKDIWHRISGIFILVQYMFDTIINQMSSTSSTINNVNKITSTKPHLSSCFSPYTNILTISGDILLKNIQPGTILNNNTIITSILELNGKHEDIYQLDNIIVTGSHPVFYKKWIKVHQHPQAKLLSDVILNTVYCFNTSNKIIKLNNTLFKDWDETNLNEMKNLYPEYSNITLECENGLHKDTQIVLENRTNKPISEIIVGEKLLNTTVVGIVKIYGLHVSLYESNKIIGSKYALNTSIKTKIHTKEPYLYHLLTVNNYFWVKGNKLQLVYDYDNKTED